MDTLTLKVLFTVGFLSAWAIRIPYQKQNKQHKAVVARQVRQEQCLFVLIYLGMVLLPFLYVFSPWLSPADYRPSVWAGALGVILFTMALWLLWRAHYDLGKNWSPTLELREGHTLISSGIYQHIRHPMYSAFWLWNGAQALLLPNWIAGLDGLIAFGLTYLLRISQEEQMLLEQFGDGYRAYMQRTKRLIPYLF
ncbi:isoprenylcysteine carboxylmethyltransferase family protein [Leptolyngbya sp. FACHB-321]|uniref:protein-S-isoprenylcysteine O-methyltransferase n=1 Tax=Leptolyngbya sp. FACHB-321 TaxID=2692807 RepID=UPI001685D317|nr:protein-S-isoprenylcysteine O-methyltransferase [Leptolyngbya sp. FACHB-321]MBD2034531.1 isoprenylcysteine carboxylmethyltransferase family protein [Leptolyngbya sp. FACHB-321]